MPIRSPAAAPIKPPHPKLEPASIVACLAPVISRQRIERIERVVSRRMASVTLVIERPYDPHNAAAVIRSSEALGLLHLHIVPFEAEAGFSFSRAVTQSADKWIDIYLHDDIKSAIGFLHQRGFCCWAALPPALDALDSSESSRAPECDVLDALDIDRPVALLIGNEHDGLSTDAVAACDGRFHLPMYGFSESLNLSVSAALALQQVISARRRHLGADGDLPGWARQQLRACYFAASVRRVPEILLRALDG